MPCGPDGRYIRLAPGSVPVVANAPVVPPKLDLKSIARTISSVKEWLATEPSREDAAKFLDYEFANAMRSGVVGPSGCLTEYFEKLQADAEVQPVEEEQPAEQVEDPEVIEE